MRSARPGPAWWPPSEPEEESTPTMRGHCPTGDTPYPPARFARLARRLEAMGVTVKADEEAKRLCLTLGSDAGYWPEIGGPGVLVLGPEPTCAEVIEEVMHIFQHRAGKWGDIAPLKRDLELATQYAMVKRAMRWGWPDSDIARLARAGVRHYDGV